MPNRAKAGLTSKFFVDIVYNMVEKFKRVGAILLDQFRKEGLRGTFVWLYGCLLWEICKFQPKFRQQVKEYQEFDHQFGVDTAGVIKLEELALPPELRSLGYHYEPCFPWLVREYLSFVPGALSDYSYIDLGSGKGRVLLIAAQYPFQRVVGVEFAAELAEVAAKNLKSAVIPQQRCYSLEAHCLDAARFEFPAGPLVISLFNPFGETILRQVLANLALSLKESPRPVVLVYVNPKHSKVVEESALFQLRRKTRKYKLYYHQA